MKNDPSAAPRFVEGQKLAGCYLLKQRIDSFGEPGIWLAHDEVLGKDVSLHFVPALIVNNAEAMNGLRQEVKRARQLIHPNILRVYDLVEGDDWAAVSMDAFAGESLASRLAKSKDGCLDAEEIQPWIPQVCQTLDDAHKINVIHGDLSPKNLLLCDSPENVLIGSTGKLFVTNFGISRLIADAEARISGKPHARLAARSPQQVTGESASRLDDVYALGALLFESLTGRLPFSGADLPGKIQNTRPQTVSQLRGKNARRVSESWEKTIAACLEKAPESRPQSVAEIAGKLGSLGKQEVPGPEAAASASQGIGTTTPEAVPKSVETKSSVETKPTNESSDASAKTSVPASSDQRNSAPEISSGMAGEESRFPGLGLALAAGLMVMGAVGYYFNGMETRTQNPDSPAALAPSEPSEGSELRPASNVLPAAQTPVKESPPAPVDAAPVPVPAVEKPATLLAAAATPAAATKPESAPGSATSSATPSDEEKDVAEKAALVEKARKAAQAAEKARAEMAEKQQQAQASVAEMQKTLEQKTKAINPVKKAAAEAIALRSKLQDEQKAADLAADQARQLAEEKARLAEAAKKAIAELEAKNKEKLAAQEKAENEIQAIQKALADRQQSGAGMAKALAEAEVAHQKNLASVKQSEQELEQAKLAAAEARRLREEAEAERRKLAQELAEMQKMMERKKAEIEDRLKKIGVPEDKSPASTAKTEPAPAPAVQPSEKKPAPILPIKPAPQSTPAAATPVPQTPTPVAVQPKPAPLPPMATPTPATPLPVIATPKPSPQTPPPQLALKTEPDKVATLPVTPAPKPVTPIPGSENSLGMKFVPLGEVEFCIWQTRVKDFEVFAKAVNLKSSAWKGPGFKQTPDHPVVNVTWIEAVAFCKWLTDREHKDGTLPANQFYRLPTDLEWSKAVGLAEETGKSPEARDMGVSDVYPWGNQWPPPPRAGNYTGEETGSDVAIKGYDDGYPWTSPVGSFPPNKFGLYDMGGNVWQWCMDAWNNDSRAKVLRGASWYNGALKLSLLSSCRVHASPDSSTDNYGFRMVRAAEGGKAGKN